MVRPFSDAAYRASETIQQHIADGKAGRWAAIRLSDGGSDGIAYDCVGRIFCQGYPVCTGRADAVRHQLHETMCMYIKIPHDSFPPAHADRLLELNRQIYDAGFKLADPDAPLREIITPERR